MATARIIIAFDSSQQWSVAGEETAIREQYEALRGVLQEVDGVHPRFFELTGFRDLADRKPEQFIVRVEDIKAVDLQET
ncbi:hypothetical protein LCGC14_0589590 [marine sediment metagenome]|uniref:Uncharacterized protein n=1 Tax=marine sediment metagenome TaxID=412755 RepID=A0A0F9RDT1_9ZZZZ